MVPRGSGHPDLSQRPRREAPGMLTGLAILERELGRIEYERLGLERRLAGRLAKADAAALRRELGALERRKRQTVRLLEQMNEEYAQRGEA